MRTVLWFVALVVCLCAVSSQGADSPPAAPVRMVIDNHWGVDVEDPYRYMENLDDPEVQAWFRGQADFAASYLGRLPGRQKLLDRIVELDAGQPYEVYSVRLMPDGSYFYYRQEADEDVAKLCYRKSLDSEERVLIDPGDKTTPTGGHYTLYLYGPSPDGSLVYYGLAASGSEDVTLYVYDMATGKNLDEEIDRLEPYYTPPQWLPDGSGFFYCRLRKLPPEAPVTDGYKRTQTFLHRLGNPVDNDVVMFEMDQYSGVNMLDVDFPSLDVTYGSEFVIGKIKHGDANQLTMHASKLNDILSGTDDWQKLCDVPDSVVDYAVHGDHVYLLTSKGSPRYKILRVNLTGSAAAETFVPQSEYTLTGLATAKDALYVTALYQGAAKVFRVDYQGGTMTMLEPPDGAPSAYLTGVDSRLDGVSIVTASWIKKGSRYAYDPARDTYTEITLEPRGKFDDPEGLEFTHIEVPSHDGVMVPLTIIHKSGIPMDGSNPTLLNGYGAYGLSSSPGFSPTSLAWLERGGILAEAHVRGGGEKGESWHLGGQKTTKPNTWKDFIACAEYLIAQKYTSPRRLAGEGGSAGGILIGRAITERPDLFAAAHIAVGDEDMVRSETTTNGVPNIQEFGTVAIEEEFHALLEMSAYHHVEDGVAYPAVLLTHGINDPRVEPWMSGKMCARLQAATSSKAPIIFRVDYQAGHGIGSTRTQYQEQYADFLAFLFHTMGIEI